MVFINYNWVSCRQHWSVNLYTNRKETTIYMRRHNTQNNPKDTEHTKQKEKHTKQEHKHKTKNIKRIIQNNKGQKTQSK